MEDIIVIVGPTGVGKTKLSVELAKRIDAEIINGDSVSIYKKLDIGSAKPTIEERQNIPHHLFDIKEVTEEYSVYDYQQDVRKKIEEITSREKRIIIVGGTGLYIKAALYNYEFTKKDTSITKDYDNLSNEEIMEKIKEYTEEVDIHLNNRQRLIRYLEKLENKEVISNKKDEALYPIKVIGLTTAREYLYERINDRVDKMMESGLLEEVTSLKKYYKDSRILNSAIGYKEFFSYLFEDKSLDSVLSEIKQNSRRYAKRQYTFFNHQFDTNWFEVDFHNFSHTIEEVYQFIIK